MTKQIANRGIVEFEWDGVTYTLRFTYDAIDSIERKFGEEWMVRLTDVFNGRSIADLPFIGSQASAMTQKQIKSNSPAVVPFVNALFKAWELAWHGEETQLAEVDGADEKKLMSYVRALMKRAMPGSA